MATDRLRLACPSPTQGLFCDTCRLSTRIDDGKCEPGVTPVAALWPECCSAFDWPGLADTNTIPHSVSPPPPPRLSGCLSLDWWGANTAGVRDTRQSSSSSSGSSALLESGFLIARLSGEAQRKHVPLAEPTLSVPPNHTHTQPHANHKHTHTHDTPQAATAISHRPCCGQVP